ncbi:hypothetical protein RF55_5333 [Lasius niger]|uniref:Uncharacterized protein n=1 Tax=Lasius niger TaxID=67767 RepID=A0A0J7KW83_LASNI|nr:hypothetical protein RF55_5333 [Lasius niger]
MLAVDKAKDSLRSESLFKGARYFAKISHPLLKPWYLDTGEELTRPVISMISRIRTYHVALHSHLCEKNIVSTQRNANADIINKTSGPISPTTVNSNRALILVDRIAYWLF